jgi:hypothetical protein
VHKGDWHFFSFFGALVCLMIFDTGCSCLFSFFEALVCCLIIFDAGCSCLLLILTRRPLALRTMAGVCLVMRHSCI